MLSKIKTAILNPVEVKWEIHNRLYPHLSDARPLQLMSSDWDNLVLLDGCRYDIFESVNSIEGVLSKRRTPGTWTQTFMKRTFTETYPDTVVVTATVQYDRVDIAGKFHHVERVWEDHWDEEYKTVLPKHMRKKTIDAAEKFPNKRIISHFVQPHVPFIGEAAKELPAVGLSGQMPEFDGTIWDAVGEGVVDSTLVWEAYEENLELALSDVDELVDEITGKTVITSDHGNAIGEKGVYGHPARRHIPALTEVPWLECPYDSRKTISEEPVVESEDVDEDVIESRLRDLGYLP